jgi:threonine dehydrogenase-like Zn-dependent dehydrogenase
MRVVEWEGPERLRLTERPEPRAEPGQAVVAVSACGICGSDLHSYRSGFATRPGQVLGHEFAGVVVEAPGVEGIEPGARVTVRPLMPCGECAACLRGDLQLCVRGLAESVGYGRDGAFAERVLVPRAVPGLTIFPLPDGLDDRTAALSEPLAVALHAVQRAPQVRGADALVLGAGTIGLGVVAYLRLAGAGSITAVDPSPLRRDAAVTQGADRAIDATAAQVEGAAGTAASGVEGVGATAGEVEAESADVVFECAGADATMAAAIRAVRSGGAVVISALFGRRVEFSPDRVTAKEASLIGAFGYQGEFADVVEALASGAVDGGSLISHELPLERIDEAFRIQGDAAASLKVLVRP